MVSLGLSLASLVGKAMCGTPSGGEGVDCVKTHADAESCGCFFLDTCVRVVSAERGTVGGGCTVAISPFGHDMAEGKNCKAIPNVDDVLCDGGGCKVLSFKDGFWVYCRHRTTTVIVVSVPGHHPHRSSMW